MNDFTRLMTSPVAGEYIKQLIYFLICFSVSYLVIGIWHNWSVHRQQSKRLTASAQSFARLAVFDSWVRSGGRTTALEESVELGLRNEWGRKAMQYGEEYYSEFCEAEEQADQELIAVIKRLGGTISHDKKYLDRS